MFPMFHHLLHALNNSNHSVSGMIASIISAITARFILAKKSIMIMISTHVYAGSLTPKVEIDYKPVFFSEGIVTCFTIAGAVTGYLVVFIIKGILADPDAWLTIKFHWIIEKLKFKRKKGDA